MDKLDKNKLLERKKFFELWEKTHPEICWANLYWINKKLDFLYNKK